MAPNGPPDDFNNQETRHANIGAQQPTEQPAPAEPLDEFDEQTEPIVWYRRPVVLISWAVFCLILIALIVYGITELVEDQGTSNTPSTTTTTTTTTTPPTTTTTTETTAPTSTTTSTPEPTASSTAEPPPPQPTRTQPQPTRRHHWPSWLPSTLPALP